uniref:Diguanylate cyclase DosC n=1 Tax=Magnetococcus massalia (strain MO-1) TaxID=451514 RepID=A0A1S7LJ91_MAGMO|nr:putative Diguanylate cyclase [Candidatus Magnetococcus massalia]
MSSRDEERLKEIYLGQEAENLLYIGKQIEPVIAQLVHTFYDELLQDEEARFFLDSDIVKTRLTSSLTAWFKLIFTAKDEPQLEALFAYQKNIGNVHARINIPMHLVVEGMRILRREITSYLSNTEIPREQLVVLVVLVSEILDHNLSLVNESYVLNAASYERNSQAMRLQLPPAAQALECEKLRSSLRSWCSSLWKLNAKREATSELPTLGRAEFGLWIFHKAPLVLPNQNLIETIQQNVQAVDGLMGRQAVTSQNAQDFDAAKIRSIEDTILSIELSLDMMIDEVLEQESGRDPLTKVFNRRFLDTVVKHEMEVSMRHEIRFGFLLCDIDHFKSINDTHGHDAGDAVLQQFAEILTNCARANDYIFRFGGEEFLFLFGDMSKGRLEHLAEKIRTGIEEGEFALPSGGTLRITASFGGSIHDGHPSFQRTLKRSDEALYEAKQTGRNRCIIYS